MGFGVLVVSLACGLVGLLLLVRIRSGKLPPKARFVCEAWKLAEQGKRESRDREVDGKR